MVPVDEGDRQQEDPRPGDVRPDQDALEVVRTVSEDSPPRP